MANFAKLVIAAFFSLFSAFSLASYSATADYYSSSYPSLPHSSSINVICQETLDYVNAAWQPSGVSGVLTGCTVNTTSVHRSDGVDYNFVNATAWLCPANSTLSGQTCTSNSGYTDFYNGTSWSSISSNPTGNSSFCPPAGTTRMVNLTLGYTDDASGSKAASVDTYADKLAAIVTAGGGCAVGGSPGSATPASCGFTIVADVNNLGKAWISMTPNSQGLYRVSQDYKVTNTGVACTASSGESKITNNTDAPTKCAGVVGTVNGKAVCVPSALSNRNSIQASSPIGTGTRLAGNPAAGSDGSQTLAGRLPTSGTGNNDGGPSHALDGSSAPWGSPLPTTTIGVQSGASGSGSGGGTSGGALDSTLQSVKSSIDAAAASALKKSDLADIKTDCDKHPDTIGCINNLDNPTPDNLSTKTVDVAITEDSGWGPSSSSCPAPHSITLQGHTFSFGISQLCDFAAMIRPVILGVAWFTAALMMLGIGRRS